MSKVLRRIVKISRVLSKNTPLGKVYVPRICISGQEVRDLGWEFEDRVEVLFDIENETVIIRRVK